MILAITYSICRDFFGVLQARQVFPFEKAYEQQERREQGKKVACPAALGHCSSLYQWTHPELRQTTAHVDVSEFLEELKGNSCIIAMAN